MTANPCVASDALGAVTTPPHPFLPPPTAAAAQTNAAFKHELSKIYRSVAALISAGLPSFEQDEYNKRAATYDTQMLGASRGLSALQVLLRRLEQATLYHGADCPGPGLVPSPTLNARECALIHAYTCNLPPIYFLVNACGLAAAARNAQATTAPLAASISAAMVKLSPFVGWASRAMGMVEQDSYSTVQSHLTSFLSCTTNPEQANPFAGKQNDGRVIPVHLHEGAAAVYMGQFALNASEAEVVCPPGCFVTAHRDDGGKLLFLEAYPTGMPTSETLAASSAIGAPTYAPSNSSQYPTQTTPHTPTPPSSPTSPSSRCTYAQTSMVLPPSPPPSPPPRSPPPPSSPLRRRLRRCLCFLCRRRLLLRHLFRGHPLQGAPCALDPLGEQLSYGLGRCHHSCIHLKCES